MQFVGFCDQIVDVVPEHFALRVAEEVLRRGIPDGDIVVEVGRDDCSGTELEQRLQVLLLAPQLCLALLKRFVRKLGAP